MMNTGEEDTRMAYIFVYLSLKRSKLLQGVLQSIHSFLTIKQMTKKNLLELVSHYSKVAEYKINIQKPMTFIAARNKWNLI